MLAILFRAHSIFVPSFIFFLQVSLVVLFTDPSKATIGQNICRIFGVCKICKNISIIWSQCVWDIQVNLQ